MQVYLDNSATTRPCPQSVEAVAQSMTEAFHNPSALYAPAMRAEHALADARRAIAATLGAQEKNVIFTSGGTESDNLAIWGRLAAMHHPGEVLYTAAEHEAVKNACLEAQARYGVAAREIPLLPSGTVDLTALEGMLGPQTALICVMQALSAHKIHGPKGVGALVLADGARIKPIVAGGGQQGGLRSGTENTSGIAGMVAAVQSYPSDAMERMRGLKRLLLSLLTETLPETTVAGLPVDDPMSAGHILNVSFPPVRAETLLHALEADGICVGTGSACSSKKGRRSPVLTAMHLPPQVMDSAIRMSLCPFNTEEEMRYTAEKIIDRVGQLRRFTRR